MALPPPALPGSGSTVGGAASRPLSPVPPSSRTAPSVLARERLVPARGAFVVIGAIALHEHHEQRDHQADDADDHQDQPHGLELDPGNARVDRVTQNRARGDQEKRHSDSHWAELYPQI